MKDHQRKKVYQSEMQGFDVYNLPTFDTIGQCEEFINLIKSSQHWKAHKGWQRVKVKDGRARQSACYMSHDKSVRFPKWARSKLVIIHEMAHCLTHRTHGRSVPAHGSTFCAHYLCLVYELLGAKAGDTLRIQFRSRDVLINPNLWQAAEAA